MKREEARSAVHMDSMNRVRLQLGPNDETVDTDRNQVSAITPAPAHGPYVQLVEGSGTELTRETRILLRSRLRGAAFVLALGFFVFIIWRVVAAFFDTSPVAIDSTFFSQLVVFLVLISSAMPLCRSCEASGRSLRFEEFLIFGSPAVFFFFFQYTLMRECAVKEHLLPRPDAPWMLLMFTYSMFIPNTWRRAAVVVGMMAISPLILTAVLWATDSLCAELIRSDWWEMVSCALIMLVSAVASVIGVYTINALRLEAFEARQLGQYKLGEKLGGGGMGEVYLAEHLLMKRPVAIKVIRPEKAGDPRTLARFEREVRATAKLSHWNNIDIFDYGRAADGTFYYVMEYLPGLSLADLVARFGPLPPERVIFLLRQTCDALSEAHTMGLIHRDIKPANIFAAQRGNVYDVAKLLDFGMVKPVDNLESPELTHDGSITGSPLFMSPEQAIGDAEPDERSDIYSLGVVAYYLLTGRTPFEGTQPLKILLAHAQRQPAPPSSLHADVPADLESVVMRCLSKSPDERFASASELAQALDQCEHANRWSFARAADWWAEATDPYATVRPGRPSASVPQPAAHSS